MRVRVAQIGARKNYAVPTVLANAHMLESLCTDLYFDGYWSTACFSAMRSLGLGRHAATLSGRKCTAVSRSQVRTFPMYAFANKREVRRARKSNCSYQAYLKGGQLFASKVASLPWRNVDAVYAFSSAALEVFRAAKQHGVKCILDHETAPAAQESSIVTSAQWRFKDWLPFEPKITSIGVEEYAARQQEESKLADIVICPSTFSAGLTFNDGVDRRKVKVVPFAMAEYFARDPGVESHANGYKQGPLRVLFVGNDEVRKGLPDLVQALETLPKNAVDAKGAGDWNLAPSAWERVRNVMEPLGGVPRTQMLSLYQWADVFVLPTYCDTMGVVILEAMASGVPVITTAFSGGPDFINHGEDGFIVQAGDADAIAQVLGSLNEDRDYLRQLSDAAQNKSRQFAMRSYGEKLVDAIYTGNSTTDFSDAAH